MSLVDKMANKVPKALVLPAAGVATYFVLTNLAAQATGVLSEHINNPRTLSNVVFAGECVLGSVIMKRPFRYAMGEVYDFREKLSVIHPINSIRKIVSNYHLTKDALIFGLTVSLVTGGLFFTRGKYYDKFVREGYPPKVASKKVDYPINAGKLIFYNTLGAGLMHLSLKSRRKSSEQ